MQALRTWPWILIATCWSGAAHADSSGSTAAQALFDQARKLMVAGKFAEACPKLQESQRLDPGGGTILALARCHAKEGKTATAWAEYQDALRIALRDNRKDREKLARDEGIAIESRLSKLIIEVPKAAQAPELTIRRDGQVVSEAQYALAIAVDPGLHAVEATAPGHVKWSKSAELRGDGAVVTVTVPPLAAAPKVSTAVAQAGTAPASSPPPPPPESESDPSNVGTAQRIGGAAVAGVGVALVAVGSVFGLKAKASNDLSKQPESCPLPNVCTEAGKDTRDRAILQARVSTVLFGVGAAALAGGAALWFTAPRAEGVSVALDVGIGQATLRGTW